MGAMRRMGMLLIIMHGWGNIPFKGGGENIDWY